MLLYFSSMQETSLPNYTYIVHGICGLFGGVVAGRRSARRGWYHGGLTGLIYGLVVLLIGFLSLDQSFNGHNAVVLALCLLAGAIGGMTGVNTKKNLNNHHPYTSKIRAINIPKISMVQNFCNLTRK